MPTYGQTTPLASMRVHGTSAHVEFPEKTIEGQPIDRTRNKVLYYLEEDQSDGDDSSKGDIKSAGSGTIVRGHEAVNVWVHFSIPAPMLLEANKFLSVSKAFVFFETSEQYVELKEVRLFDGKEAFFSAGLQGASGNLTNRLLPKVNSWDTNHQVILHSLGISVRVYLPAGPEKYIRFTGAGADYSTFTPLTIVTHFPR